MFLSWGKGRLLTLALNHLLSGTLSSFSLFLVPFKYYTFISILLFAWKYKFREEPQIIKILIPIAFSPEQYQGRNALGVSIDALWLTKCLRWARSSYVISSPRLQLTVHPSKQGSWREAVADAIFVSTANCRVTSAKRNIPALQKHGLYCLMEPWQKKMVFSTLEVLDGWKIYFEHLTFWNCPMA